MSITASQLLYNLNCLHTLDADSSISS